MNSNFLALRGRSQIAVGLLVVSAVVSLISIMYELELRGLIGDILAGRPVSYTALETADDRTSLVAVLSLAALAGTAVAFVAWFHRAYTNIERLGVSDLRASRGWSIGAWFVPILNLIRPKQLMDDTWRASDPALPAKVGSGWQERPVPGLLHAWWALFLISGVLGNVAGRRIAEAATPDARLVASVWSLLSDGALLVAADDEDRARAAIDKAIEDGKPASYKDTDYVVEDDGAAGLSRVERRDRRRHRVERVGLRLPVFAFERPSQVDELSSVALFPGAGAPPPRPSDPVEAERPEVVQDGRTSAGVRLDVLLPDARRSARAVEDGRK
jgi:hypothetical protein